MVVIDEIQRGSYRSIPFFYQNTRESGGFKTAQHLYPGSNNFILEQLGNVPREFNVECRVQFENRDSFDNALNTAGVGILTHPMYGNFLVKVKEYEKNDSISELGFYSYSVIWVVEIGLVIPTVQGIGLSIINNTRAQVLSRASVFLKNVLTGVGF